jgi:hypothetical protein
MPKFNVNIQIQLSLRWLNVLTNNMVEKIKALSHIPPQTITFFYAHNGEI